MDFWVYTNDVPFLNQEGDQNFSKLDHGDLVALGSGS